MDANQAPIRLLLVDDEEEFLLATSQALGRRGFEVSAAPNGVTALEKVADEVFDVVVLDVKMPDIDGIEVFGQIRSRRPDMPVIILTGHPSIGDAFHTSKQGIAEYLSKPVEMDVLAKKARQVVIEARRKIDGSRAPEEDVDARTGPINVLIVDDETDLLDSLQRVFTRRKLNTRTADSGPKALEILQEELVDVMVLDVKMPVMDGLEVLRRVRGRYPSILVILLSGHPSVEAALEGVKLGASEYLKKPPDIDELVATIVRLYGQRREILEAQQARLIDEIRRRYPD
jgi:DNA-binding NtrC family response regulator